MSAALGAIITVLAAGCGDNLPQAKGMPKSEVVPNAPVGEMDMNLDNPAPKKK